MTTARPRPGDPELAMIEILELAINEPGHTFSDLGPEIEAMFERHLFAEVTDETVGGTCSVRVKPMGRSAVRRFRERQANKIDRKRALPDKYLRYIWERHEAGSHGTPSDFLATEPHWCGDVYTAAEVERAGAWLYERGFVTGVLMNNSDAPIRVEITSVGADRVENRQSVHEQPVTPTANNHFHNTITGGNVNVAQQAAHFTQTQDNRSGAAAALELADAAVERVSHLPSEHRAGVAAAASDLRDEAQGPARGQRLRELSNKVFTAVVTAGAVNGANDLGAQLMPHLQKVLEAIGS